MKKIILAAILFLPFLVSCSQNRKAPDVSPQTAEEKSEKTETAKVQYLTTSDFRKKIMDYEAHPDEWVFAGSRPAVIDFYTTLTTSDFRKKIMDYEAHPDEWVFAGSRPAVIDFYTTWCGPCKMMAPVVESLAEKYAGKIDFYKVDIDQESELASSFLFIPVKCKPAVQMGAMQKEDFEGLIDKIKIK